MNEKLDTIEELATRKNLAIRTVRSLMSRGIIPYLKLGHRPIRFEPSKVEKALSRREVKPKTGLANDVAAWKRNGRVATRAHRKTILRTLLQ